MKETAQAQWDILPGNLFVFYGGPGHFTEADYHRWYSALTTSNTRLYLGGTARGFQLSGEQRRHGRSFFQANQVCFVTVTDDPIVRGFVTTGSWFGLDIAAFGWNQLRAATSRLGLDEVAAERAQKTLLRLRTAVECKLHAAVTQCR